jgi:hypothetical protein
MAAVDLDPTARLCMRCGVRGCSRKHSQRRRWFGRGRRD